MNKEEFKKRFVQRFKDCAQELGEQAFDGGKWDYEHDDPEDCADEEMGYMV